MNIHPLLVHFPIGLLVIYALMELVPRRFHTRFLWWHDTKVFVLTLGILMAVPTLISGDMASDLVRGKVPEQLVEKHEMFAITTFVLYLVLWLAYAIRTFVRTGWGDAISMRLWHGSLTSVWRIKQRVANAILDTPLRPLLALAALAAITITGGLGAAIVYGPDIDPFVSVIYHFFF